ncbi:MAG: hypothetical protein KC593_04740 [Myxococcales bacterium]|nr:hypothetical protein [Myxococcales bacterium]
MKVLGPVLTVLLALPLLAGCGSDAPPPIDDGTFRPVVELGRHRVTLLDTRQVVPSAGLPSEVTPQASNNNVDVIRHEGRVYMAWRTAPDHFAGPDTIMYVVSSSDELSWRYEAEFALGTDVREPRFLAVDGTLFLYMSVLGVSELEFMPMGVRYATLPPGGSWSGLSELYGDDTLVWRPTTVPDGRHFMTAYNGGENIYTFSGDPLQIHFRTSTDGINWTPVGSGDSVVYEGGGSETAYALADNGDLFAVIRVEATDALGLGSRVCRADRDDLGSWNCNTDFKKYDSPHMFAYDREIYLVARRNVTETGYFGGEGLGNSTVAGLRYVTTPKRCSLWRIVQDELRVAYITDLPSNGDTCFPSVIEGSEPGEFVVYDYSSDPDGPQLNWRPGQLGPTQLYRHVLQFRRR